MNKTDILRDQISRQLRVNESNNLFHSDWKSSFVWLEDTLNFKKDIQAFGEDEITDLVDYMTRESLEVFCKINQYFSFDSDARYGLSEVYRQLIEEVRTSSDFEVLRKKHYGRLKDWLMKTNPFACDMYNMKDAHISSVPCAEYSVALQLQLLDISPEDIKDPVLDIGSGKSGALVKFLKEKGFEVYGIDRSSSLSPNCIVANWLEFEYRPGYWGTIISHLGFSNHFRHHNERKNGDYLDYARKYMEIIQSLKSGGSFHYAPGVPFIECYLDSREYNVTSKMVNETGLYATRITRV